MKSIHAYSKCEGNAMKSARWPARIFWIYLTFAILLCLLMPNSTGISDLAGIDVAKIPLYSWIANVNGVLPFYPDYFLAIWASLPPWLGIYALCYVRAPFPTPAPTHSPVVLFATSLAVVACLLFIDVDVSDNVGKGSRLLVAAAKDRLLGAIVFGVASATIFAVCALAFVKIPSDIIKRAP